MLEEFQKALADLTASPALCREVRADTGILHARYRLSDKEQRRLAGIVASKGMEANCMLYRANRLAPVALNLPDTCNAIASQLNDLISVYWEANPTTDVHFLVEAERFCKFLWDQPALPEDARERLTTEYAVIAVKLAASRSMARSAGSWAESQWRAD